MEPTLERSIPWLSITTLTGLSVAEPDVLSILADSVQAKLRQLTRQGIRPATDAQGFLYLAQRTMIRALQDPARRAIGLAAITAELSDRLTAKARERR